jgi:plastocyanin
MFPRRTAVPVLLLTLAGLACSSSTDYGSGGGTFTPPAADVLIVSGASNKTTTAFNPNPFTIAVNGSVKWGNGDPGVVHHIRADGASPAFESGNLAAGATYTFTFSQAGTYTYHCTIHPNMVASIVVNP